MLVTLFLVFHDDRQQWTFIVVVIHIESKINTDIIQYLTYIFYFLTFGPTLSIRYSIRPARDLELFQNRPILGVSETKGTTGSPCVQYRTGAAMTRA